MVKYFSLQLIDDARDHSASLAIWRPEGRFAADDGCLLTF
jgi:hypothetical protein